MKKVGALNQYNGALQILFTMFVLLVGCSNALNYEVAKLTDQQRIGVRQTLTADQLKSLDDWIARNTSASKGLPAGVTVEKALKDQADWLAMQKIEEAKAGELRKRAQAERKAKQQELLKVLSVVLVSKKNTIREDERKFVALEIACDNKTDKDIQEVKGVIKLTDIYGIKITDIDWSYDSGIAARGTAIDHGAGIFINKLMESQVMLWNTDFEKMKSTFEVKTIIFKDGTGKSAPE